MRTYVRVRRGDDPARRPRRVLRVGRAARRSAPARAAGDRRRRRRARRELRGEGVRRPHRDGRRAGAAALPAARSSSRRGCPPTPRRARRCSASSTTRRRSSRGCRSTRRSSTCAGCERIAGTPAEIAARLRRDVLERGRPADHGRRRADEVPRQGRERRREARRAARRAARPRARVPPPAAGRAALGRRAGDRAQAPRAGDHDRRRGRAARARPRSSRCSAGRPGRHLHALAHNRDPRPVQVGRRRALDRLAARARPRRRRSAEAIDATLVGARRPRHAPDARGAAASAARSCCGCASTTSRARRARTRCRTRPRTPRRSSPRRAALLAAAMPIDRARRASRSSASRSRTSTTTTPSSSRCRSTAPRRRARRRARRGARPVRVDGDHAGGAARPRPGLDDAAASRLTVTKPAAVVDLKWELAQHGGRKMGLGLEEPVCNGGRTPEVDCGRLSLGLFAGVWIAIVVKLIQFHATTAHPTLVLSGALVTVAGTMSGGGRGRHRICARHPREAERTGGRPAGWGGDAQSSPHGSRANEFALEVFFAVLMHPRRRACLAGGAPAAS